MAAAAALARSGAPSPHASATDTQSWGRSLPPPGKTAWRAALIKVGGAPALETDSNADSRHPSMRWAMSIVSTVTLCIMSVNF